MVVNCFLFQTQAKVWAQIIYIQLWEGILKNNEVPSFKKSLWEIGKSKRAWMNNMINQNDKINFCRNQIFDKSFHLWVLRLQKSAIFWKTSNFKQIYRGQGGQPHIFHYKIYQLGYHTKDLLETEFLIWIWFSSGDFLKIGYFHF